MPRTLIIDRHRLPGWFERFEKQQGQLALIDPVQQIDTAQLLDPTQTINTAQISAAAHLIFEAPSGHRLKISGTALIVPKDVPNNTPNNATSSENTWREVLERARWDITVGIILVRRGGFSIGVAQNGKLLTSKSDTKYVQGRTAAGGWSQQRFARRRAGQTAGLVTAAIEAAARIFGENTSRLNRINRDPTTSDTTTQTRTQDPKHTPTQAHTQVPAQATTHFPTHAPTRLPKSTTSLEVLTVGGDRPLIEAVLADAALAPFSALPRVSVTVHGDPRQRDAARIAEETQALSVTITDP